MKEFQDVFLVTYKLNKSVKILYIGLTNVNITHFQAQELPVIVLLKPTVPLHS